jgi:hypothetical protein
MRAFRDEAFCCRKADAAVAAGDQCYFLVELSHVDSPNEIPPQRGYYVVNDTDRGASLSGLRPDVK